MSKAELRNSLNQLPLPVGEGWGEGLLIFSCVNSALTSQSVTQRADIYPPDKPVQKRDIFC